MSRPEDRKPGETGGFLDRWTKRKQEVLREQEVLRKREAQKDQTPILEEPPVGNLSVEAGESLPLPSLDDILPGSDVSAFFQKHVPDALRSAALRKVWMTDPDIKDFIEMADYQLDYANPDSIPGWSSSIEGVDLKSMVEKIFNNGPKIEGELPTSQVEALVVADETANEAMQPVHTHSTLVETSDDPALVAERPDVIQNGAVQNTPDESVVYETARKRHGSALPS
jgi:Protein of unknown function (DUF3306)